MRKRRYLKKVAFFLTLAVTLNTASLSVHVLAEEFDQKNQEVSVEQSQEQITDDQKQEKAEESNQDENQEGVLESDERKTSEGEVELEEDKVIPEISTPGWYYDGKDWYYYDTDGKRAVGWRYIGNCWYYLNDKDEQKPGVMSVNELQMIGGKMYAFDASGAMRYNCWIYEEEGWYYAESNGAFADGWKYINGYWYYFEGSNEEHPYLMVNNTRKTIDDRDYYFTNNGEMRCNCWILETEGWYYVDGSGILANGWRYVNGSWYYMDGNNEEHPGLMVSGQDKIIAGVKYSFNPSGAMRAGWYISNSGDWYYYDNYSGQICSGWKYVNNNWYYLDPQNNNKMIPGGWKKFDNGYYLFNSDGSMVTNWSYVNGNWYYFSSDGLMRTGWQWIGNKWYYFYYENDSHGGVYGAMARATSIDGWQLQADGSMLSGKQAEMLAKAQAYTSNTNYLILVDRAACKVSIFAGRFGAWNNIKYWDCAPGKASTPTVSGTFTVQSKGYYFDSGSARCYWYTQFHGNYLFHSVLYSKYNGSLMDGRVGIPLSHGCVRLQIDNAKWIYDNIPRGTKVVIY